MGPAGRTYAFGAVRPAVGPPAPAGDGPLVLPDFMEMSPSSHTIHIRDSKNPTGPVLAVSPDARAAFTGSPWAKAPLGQG